MRRAPKPIPPEHVSRLAALYAAGWTLAELGSILRCSPKHMRTVLMRAGVQMRKPGKRPGTTFPYPTARKPPTMLRRPQSRYDAAARAFLGLPPDNPSA